MLFMTSGPFPSPIFKRQLLALESRCFQIIFNCLINEYRRNGALGVLLLGPREVQVGRVQEGSKRGSNDNWEKSTGVYWGSAGAS